MTIITDTELKFVHLQALFAQRALAVRVPRFFDEAARRCIVAHLSQCGTVGRYVNAPDIARIGVAYFEKQASASTAQEYDRNAMSWIRQARDAISPFLAPMDQLRLVLDEIWPTGATLATLEGHRAFCGLVRIFPPGVAAEPHMDVLAWDVAPGHSDGDLEAQLAANIYLQTQDAGGELAIWSQSLDRKTYEHYRRPSSYGLSPESLGPETLRIKPEAGELILFNSRLVHSVLPGQLGDRVTSSAFIGLRSDQAPLVMWS